MDTVTDQQIKDGNAKISRYLTSMGGGLFFKFIDYSFSYDYLFIIVEHIEKSGYSVIIDNENCMIRVRYGSKSPAFSCGHTCETKKLAIWMCIVDYAKFKNGLTK